MSIWLHFSQSYDDGKLPEDVNVSSGCGGGRKKKKKKGADPGLSSLPPRAYALGLRGRAAFVGSPRLFLAGRRAGAVDSHFAGPGAQFGRQSVSLSVVRHAGAVGALDGGREVLGRGVGLRGGPGWRGSSGTVDFVAVGVALGRRAGVDAVGVALGGRL